MKVKITKINHIMTQLAYIPKVNHSVEVLRDYNLKKLLGIKCKELETFFGVKPGSKSHNDRMLVFNYFYKLGKTDDEIRDLWITQRVKKSERSRDMNYMPKHGRDNQNPVNNTRNYGSGGTNKNMIRVPSRKHKNRFKNFMKLFPEYCEKMGITEV